jgi:hypothetical protein
MATVFRKKNSGFCCAAALIIQILVYSSRIDKDIFQFQEFAPAPHPLCTESPLTTDISYFGNGRPERIAPLELTRSKGARERNVAAWKTVAFLCDSRVRVLLTRLKDPPGENPGRFPPSLRKPTAYPSIDDDAPAA